MKYIVNALLFTLIILSACDSRIESGDSPNIALINGTLIDGNGGTSIENAVIVIRDGRITAAGPATVTQIPTDVRIVNVAGMTVLPGFINAHIHNGFNRTNLADWAAEGVTTVRDLCGPEAFDVRDTWAEDPGLARLVAAGPMMSVIGGYPSVPWGSSCMLAVTSVEDARYEATRLILSGADILKLAVESGESFGMTIPSLSAEEAAAIVRIAHQYDTKASAHVLVSYDLGRALDCGADDIAHMVTDQLYDSLITRMVNDNVYWVPTLELWFHVGHGMLDVAIGNLRRFVQAGGLVAVGTDYDGYAAEFEMGMPMHELQWMIQAGMTPMQVIVAGTKHGAYVCNLEDDLGTIEPGKIADILVVSGNPLRDIDALADIRLVIHNGTIIRDER